MKKLNCKHGLNRYQELEARKLRKILVEEDKEKEYIIKEKLEALYVQFKQNQCSNFFRFIKDTDVSLFSALERIGGISKLYYYLEKYSIGQ